MNKSLLRVVFYTWVLGEIALVFYRPNFDPVILSVYSLWGKYDYFMTLLIGNLSRINPKGNLKKSKHGSFLTASYTPATMNPPDQTIITVCSKAFWNNQIQCGTERVGDSETVFTIRTMKIEAANHH